MKKLLFLMLFPCISFGAVTEAQVNQANTCFRAIFDCSVAGMRYTQNVKSLFVSSFTVTVPASTSTITVPTTIQNDVVNVQLYNAKKQACVDAFNLCP